MSVSANNSQDIAHIVARVQKAENYLKGLLAESGLDPRSSRHIVKAIWCLEDFALQLTSQDNKDDDSTTLKENAKEQTATITKRVHFTESEDNSPADTYIIKSDDMENRVLAKSVADHAPISADHPKTHHDDETPDAPERDVLKRAIRQNMHFYLDGNTLKAKPREVEEQKSSAARSSKTKTDKSMTTDSPTKSRK